MCNTNTYNSLHRCYMMCPKCFGYIENENSREDDMSDLHQCQCKEINGSEIFGVDTKIFKLVQMMNDKGIYTSGSCEGDDDVPWIIGFEKNNPKERVKKTKFFLYGTRFFKGYKAEDKLKEISKAEEYIRSL